MARKSDIKPYLESGPLRIEQREGSGSILLVVFSGVGMTKEKWQPIEFVKFALERPQHHILFVVDSSRSWLNAPGLMEQIEAAVVDYRARHDVQRVVCVGNSMGGFMALVMAKRLRAKSTLAISPQYSVHPSVVPLEDRWRNMRGAIPDWRVRELGPLVSNRTQHFIVQGALQPEMQHWSQMPVGPQINHYLFPAHTHFVARYLRDRCVLQPLIDHVISGRPRRVRTVLESVGALKRKHYIESMTLSRAS